MMAVRDPVHETPSEGFLDRALRNLRAGWQEIARATPVFGSTEARPHLPEDDAERVREQMRACLEARGGEVSARARAAGLGETYLSLNRQGRLRFLLILANDFDVDHEAVAVAARRLADAATPDERTGVEAELRAVLEPPRVKLLKQFNALPDGVKFLVDLRAELLDLAAEENGLRGLERDLRELLRSWLDVGFLDLHRITWQSPAALLEKLIAYEAVHEIASWDDLKNRLDSDRRCFAFFHNRMPSEPLIFVEVALVDKVSGNIQELLDLEAPVADPDSMRTAIFYSISNAQKGLAGISFGGFLIKRVVDHLSNEVKSLRTFATLSPLPGFRKWFSGEAHRGDATAPTRSERAALRKAGRELESAVQVADLLEDPAWWQDEALAEALQPYLLREGARYLLHARRPDGRAFDPVAHFHLSNGARIEALNWMADTSDKGMRQSAGMMVNYVYRLDRIEPNHEAYRGKNEIAASSAIRSLARG